MISREGSFLRKLEFRSKLGIEFHGWRSVTVCAEIFFRVHFRNCISEGDITFSTEIANKREGYEMEGASVRHKDAISRSTEGEI